MMIGMLVAEIAHLLSRHFANERMGEMRLRVALVFFIQTNENVRVSVVGLIGM
jgi:hypothetical protein